jgi:acyl-coenzyme A thioesterase PaaI-like protein
MSTYTKDLTQTVTSVPIHKALGMVLLSQIVSPQPTANLEFTTTSLHLTPNKTVHGGISSLAIDGACFLALIPTLSEGQGAVGHPVPLIFCWSS